MRRDVRLGEGLERQDPGPRQQGGVDLERGVLGRGPDEGDGPVLDGRQQGVLLGLVEAVDLVDEQDRPPAAAAGLAGLGDRLPQLLDAREDGRERRRTAVPARRASRRASVVLPVPGAPQRISEGSGPPPSTSLRTSRPSPTRCPWPTNSSSVRGRIRSASGASAFDGGLLLSGSSNRLPVVSRGIVAGSDKAEVSAPILPAMTRWPHPHWLLRSGSVLRRRRLASLLGTNLTRNSMMAIQRRVKLGLLAWAIASAAWGSSPSLAEDARTRGPARHRGSRIGSKARRRCAWPRTAARRCSSASGSTRRRSGSATPSGWSRATARRPGRWSRASPTPARRSSRPTAAGSPSSRPARGPKAGSRRRRSRRSPTPRPTSG